MTQQMVGGGGIPLKIYANRPARWTAPFLTDAGGGSLLALVIGTPKHAAVLTAVDSWQEEFLAALHTYSFR